MPCLVDVPARPRPAFSEGRQSRMHLWKREDVREQLGKREKENSGLDVMYEKRIKNKNKLNKIWKKDKSLEYSNPKYLD